MEKLSKFDQFKNEIGIPWIKSSITGKTLLLLDFVIVTGVSDILTSHMKSRVFGLLKGGL